MSELQRIFNTEQLALFRTVFPVTEGGNFEHATNALHLAKATPLASRQRPEIIALRAKLLRSRNKRTAPHLDDKVLTAWNGLMIAAMAKGYQVLREPRYLEAAQRSASFVREHLVKEGKLLRRYRAKEARFVAYLEDYAYLVHGLIALYESDFDSQWLRWAEHLTEIQQSEFGEESAGGYFFSSAADPTLLFRKKERADGALPAANSVALYNLLRLAHFTFDKRYHNRALRLMDDVSSYVARWPAAHAMALIGLDFQLSRSVEVVVVGDLDSTVAKQMRSTLYEDFLPNKVMAFGDPVPLNDTEGIPLFRGRRLLNDQTTIYVCEKGRCKLPTNDVKKALRLLEQAE